MIRPEPVIDPGFAVYVHWPFCLSKCPYCDFNSHVADTVDHERWRQALVAELRHYGALTAGRTVTSVFFGGGTPSLMMPQTVAAVIAEIANQWSLADDVEITLEANPSTAEAARFRDFAAAGVNRLSIGVQALDDTALASLGRGHSADEARRAISLASDVYTRFSFDMIYALPGQSEAAWRAELSDALDFAGDHLSLYQLTIEPGTPFHRDGVAEAEEDVGATLYDVTQETMAAAGFEAYEVSNHARPGAACRHNVAIWRGADYVGVGPGAHGRLRLGDAAHATYQIHTPERWLDRVELAGHGTAKDSALSDAVRAEELVMLGLRLAGGIDRRRFIAATGIAFDEVVDANGFRQLTDGGFLNDDGDRIKTSTDGRRCLNAVLERLLAAPA